MGGAIAAEYSRLNPGRISSLTLNNAAGLPTNKPLIAGLANLPGVGEFLMNSLLTPEVLGELYLFIYLFIYLF